jgi:hypothetical protein
MVSTGQLPVRQNESGCSTVTETMGVRKGKSFREIPKTISMYESNITKLSEHKSEFKTENESPGCFSCG